MGGNKSVTGGELSKIPYYFNLTGNTGGGNGYCALAGKTLPAKMHQSAGSAPG